MTRAMRYDVLRRDDFHCVRWIARPRGRREAHVATISSQIARRQDGDVQPSRPYARTATAARGKPLPGITGLNQYWIQAKGPVPPSVGKAGLIERRWDSGHSPALRSLLDAADGGKLRATPSAGTCQGRADSVSSRLLVNQRPSPHGATSFLRPRAR